MCLLLRRVAVAGLPVSGARNTQQLHLQAAAVRKVLRPRMQHDGAAAGGRCCYPTDIVVLLRPLGTSCNCCSSRAQYMGEGSYKWKLRIRRATTRISDKDQKCLHFRQRSLTSMRKRSAPAGLLPFPMRVRSTVVCLVFY